MKTNGVLIVIAFLLTVVCVNAQEQEIGSLKTQKLTLTKNQSRDKPASTQSWTLTESDGRQLKSVDYKPTPRSIDNIESSPISTNVGQVQVVNGGRHVYSIDYARFSTDGDDRWLHLQANPAIGVGLLSDLGEMKWEEVEQMPTLALKPFVSVISMTVIDGVKIVGPQGLILRAIPGHVYAVHVKDDRTDYRVIFRIDSIEANGDCHISWKRIPSKWVLGPAADAQTQTATANDKPANATSAYAGPPANEILARTASVYAGCRTYTDEGTIGIEGFGSAGSHFRTTFSRPDVLGFELWEGSKEPWVVWKSGDEINNSGPYGLAGRTAPIDVTLGQLAFNSKGGSLLVPQLLSPSLFRTADAFALLVDPRVIGEVKVDGVDAFRVKGTLLGQPTELWIDKSNYLIRKVVRKITQRNQQFDSVTEYKPKLNADIPAESLSYKPPAGKVNVSGTNTLPVMGSPPSPPSRAPRLREFGSSLSRRPNDDASASRRATDDDVVRIDTDLVLSPVLVLDQQGKIVTGLTKEDFIVKEDNNLQQVSTFSLGDDKELGRSIVLIIDYSPSQLPYIRTSIESAKMLVDKLNPRDRMALVTDDVQLLTDFTSDKQLLKEKLDGLKRNALSGVMGASVQYDALMATLNELFDVEDTQPIVIFQTDGDQLDLLKGAKADLGPYAFPRKYGLDDVKTASEKARVTIYPVISGVKFLGVPVSELMPRAQLDLEKRRAAKLELMEARNRGVIGSADPENKVIQLTTADRWLRCQMALADLAKAAGAWAEFLEEPDQADEIYTRVLKNIQQRYVLGYYPTNRARDAKRRMVTIQVRNHPEYVVLGRKSYFARE